MNRIKGAVKIATKDDGVCISKATEEEIIAAHAARIGVSVKKFREGLRVIDKLQRATKPGNAGEQEKESDDEESVDSADE